MEKSRAKAIADYRRRRIQRLRARFDDDNDENNAPAPAGGHGNTKLPFGLCRREGIKVDPTWTPKDAWNALEGKGYSAKEAYKELKETGKVAPRAPQKPTKTPEELKKIGKSVSDLKKSMKKRDKLEKELDTANIEISRAINTKARYESASEKYKKMADEMVQKYGSEENIPSKREGEYGYPPLASYQLYRDNERSYAKDAENIGKTIPDLMQKHEDLRKQLAEYPSKEDHKKQYDQAVDELLSNSPLTAKVRDYRAAEETGRNDRLQIGKIDRDIATLKHNAMVYQRSIEEAKKRAEERGYESGRDTAVMLYERSLMRAQEQLAECEKRRKPIAERLAEREKKMADAKGDADDKSWKSIYDLSVERDTVQDGPYDKLSGFARDLRESKVAFRAPRKFVQQPSEEEIISNLAGGDKTKGSCVSLACAYMANKAGYDVLDFRGSSSRKFFAQNWKRISIAMDGIQEISHNDVEAVNKLLKNVEEGKEYWLSTGNHAAMVRKKDGKMEFLELQSWKTNGWKELNDERLINRFKCKTRRKGTASNTLVDSSDITGSSEFMSMMGYINTAMEKQQKGEGGGEK